MSLKAAIEDAFGGSFERSVCSERGVGLSAMVLSRWRLLINRSPTRLVGVGKASDEGCLPTCFGQTSVVAAGAELVHRQGVEVDVWSRDGPKRSWFTRSVSA